MEEEFKRLYYLYKDDIFRLAFSYTGKISDAEDITQNVFVKLYNNIDKFNDDLHVKKWCMRVTINECKNLYLSFNRHKFFNSDVLYSNSTTLLNETQEILKEALFELPKKERTIIYLHYYEGYKVYEIADILKIKPATIQTILFRSKKKLKNKIKGDYDYER